MIDRTTLEDLAILSTVNPIVFHSAISMYTRKMFSKPLFNSRLIVAPVSEIKLNSEGKFNYTSPEDTITLFVHTNDTIERESNFPDFSSSVVAIFTGDNSCSANTRWKNISNYFEFPLTLTTYNEAVSEIPPVQRDSWYSSSAFNSIGQYLVAPQGLSLSNHRMYHYFNSERFSDGNSVIYNPKNRLGLVLIHPLVKADEEKICNDLRCYYNKDIAFKSEHMYELGKLYMQRILTASEFKLLEKDYSETCEEILKTLVRYIEETAIGLARWMIYLELTESNPDLISDELKESMITSIFKEHVSFVKNEYAFFERIKKLIPTTFFHKALIGSYRLFLEKRADNTARILAELQNIQRQYLDRYQTYKRELYISESIKNTLPAFMTKFESSLIKLVNEDKARVQGSSVILKFNDLQILDLYLGNFECRVDIIGSLRYTFNRTGGNPDKKLPRYMHPHISGNGEACFGDFIQLLSTAGTSGNLVEIWDLLNNFLHTINTSSPINKIESFFDKVPSDISKYALVLNGVPVDVVSSKPLQFMSDNDEIDLTALTPMDDTALEPIETIDPDFNPDFEEEQDTEEEQEYDDDGNEIR